MNLKSSTARTAIIILLALMSSIWDWMGFAVVQNGERRAMTMPEITKIFIGALCTCLAVVIITVVIAGTVFVVSAIIGFCCDKVDEIKRKREQSNDES